MSAAENLKLTLKAYPAITAATFALCFLTQHGAKALFGIDLPEQAGLEAIRNMIGWNWMFILNVALAVLILPPVEELLFRLLLFRLPCRSKSDDGWRSGSFLIPVAFVSSVLFTAVHYLQRTFPDAAFIALVFFGCAQCRLYRRTGSIVYPMLNHALFNLTTFVLLILGVS